VVKYLLALGLYLLESEVKENTEKAAVYHEPRGDSRPRLSSRATLDKVLLGKEPAESLRRIAEGGCPQRGLRWLPKSWLPGDHEHFVHLNLDFSAKLTVRLIRIGC